MVGETLSITRNRNQSDFERPMKESIAEDAPENRKMAFALLDGTTLNGEDVKNEYFKCEN